MNTPETEALNTVQTTKGLEALPDHKAALHSAAPVQPTKPYRLPVFSIINNGHQEGEDDTNREHQILHGPYTQRCPL